MAASQDIELSRRAVVDDRVLVSEDTDFGTLLTLAGEQVCPSVLLFRRMPSRRTGPLLEQMLEHLPDLEADLLGGAIVVITPERIRVRRLPLR